MEKVEENSTQSQKMEKQKRIQEGAFATPHFITVFSLHNLHLISILQYL
jgi:hypothetical protein